MREEAVILIAEDDDGHFSLVRKNLARAGIANKVIQFKDGQQILDFLFMKGQGVTREPDTPYILILDIHMPKIDGKEVLEKMKQDSELRKIPIVIMTTTNDPQEIGLCHDLGCSMYVVKPVEYEDFIETIRKMGAFFSVAKIPAIR